MHLNDSFCKGEGEKTPGRYQRHSDQALAACKLACVAAGAQCQCMDVGAVTGWGSCRFQNESKRTHASGIGLQAYVPC